MRWGEEHTSLLDLGSSVMGTVIASFLCPLLLLICKYPRQGSLQAAAPQPRCTIRSGLNGWSKADAIIGASVRRVLMGELAVEQVVGRVVGSAR